MVVTANILTVDCETSRASMRELAEEIEKVAQAVVEGNLDYRVDSGRFTGETGDIIRNINRMMDGVSTPLHDIGEFLGCFAAGDFTRRITSDSKGLADMNDSCNALAEDLTRLILRFREQTSAGNAGKSQQCSDNHKSTVSVDADIPQKAVEEIEKMTTTVDAAASRASNLPEAGDGIAYIKEMSDRIVAGAITDAGEIDQRIAAVSNEVRKLAEQISNTTRDITELIEYVQSGVGEVVKTIEQGSGE